MIKLKITVLPKCTKSLELTQSLDSIKPDLEQLCTSFILTKEDKVFILAIIMDSFQEFQTVLYSKEVSILSGAISTLGEKSEVIVYGIGNKRGGSDLQKIRLFYTRNELTKQNN
jgi:hypothetical protein